MKRASTFKSVSKSTCSEWLWNVIFQLVTDSQDGKKVIDERKCASTAQQSVAQRRRYQPSNPAHESSAPLSWFRSKLQIPNIHPNKPKRSVHCSQFHLEFTRASKNGPNSSKPPKPASPLRHDLIHEFSPELLQAFNESIVLNRQRRRVNQQRYRKKIESRALALENEVGKLQAEIDRLEVQQQSVTITSELTERTLWNVVTEYYRLFRHGCQVPRPNTKSGTSDRALQPQDVHAQTKFLENVMAPDVSVNAGFGIEAVLEQWRSVSQGDGNVVVRPRRLEYDEKSSLVATIQVSTTITEEMPHHDFPHLVGNGRQHEWSPHATKLLGQQLIIPTTVRFKWDDVIRRVSSMHSTSDLVTAFLKLLGSLDDVACVLEKSRLASVNGWHKA